MATAKQIAANRANAKKSCGPKTAAGKKVVSQNRFSHGLCGAFRVLDHESVEKFEDALAQLIADQKPVGPLETELVRKMAQTMWLRDRALSCQDSCFTITRDLPHLENDEVDLELKTVHLQHYMRYEAHHDRIFHRALSDLLKLQKERRLREIGFEREKRAAADAERKQSDENRKAELHPFKVRSAQATAERKEIALGEAIYQSLGSEGAQMFVAAANGGAEARRHRPDC